MFSFVYSFLPRWWKRWVPRPPRQQPRTVRRAGRLTRPTVVREPSQRVEDLRQSPRPLLRHLHNTTQTHTYTTQTISHHDSHSTTISNDLNRGTYSPPSIDGASKSDARFGAKSRLPSWLRYIYSSQFHVSRRIYNL